jgi:hypothetical protein
MTDISITAGNVVKGSNAVVENGHAGAAITAGQFVYLDTADMLYKLADSNGAAALRTPRGVALNSAGANQPLAIQRSGDVTIGGTLTAGVTYYLSDTPGGICPLADVGSGEYACLLGIAKSASVLAISINASGATLS